MQLHVAQIRCLDVSKSRASYYNFVAESTGAKNENQSLFINVMKKCTMSHFDLADASSSCCCNSASV